MIFFVLASLPRSLTQIVARPACYHGQTCHHPPSVEASLPRGSGTVSIDLDEPGIRAQHNAASINEPQVPISSEGARPRLQLEATNIEGPGRTFIGICDEMFLTLEASIRHPIKVVTLLSILLSVAVPTVIAAQFEGYGGCVDAWGRGVQTVRNTQLADVAAAGMGPNRIPQIQYNPSVLNKFSQTTRRWWYMHECGHHALAHGVRNIPLTQEQESDCFAIATLVSTGQFRDAEIKQVQQELSQISSGDWQHLPGPQRAFNLPACLVAAGVRSGSGGAFGQRNPPANAFSRTVQAIIAEAGDDFTKFRGERLADRSVELYESQIMLPGASVCWVLLPPAAGVACVMHSSEVEASSERAYGAVVQSIRSALPGGPWKEETDSKSSASQREESIDFQLEDDDNWVTAPYVYVELIHPRRIDASKRWGLHTVLVTFAAGTPD